MNLFLDDIRNPIDVYKYTGFNKFVLENWTIVRNFDEFKTVIEAKGLPKFIAFDHDLADSHYTPQHLWNDYNASKAWQDAQVHEEKTGYDCAKWLVDYCIDNNLKLPEYFVHSMNPVGADNIRGLLENFNNR